MVMAREGGALTMQDECAVINLPDREFLHLVVYLPQWDGITDASTMIRHSIPLGCTQAAIR